MATFTTALSSTEKQIKQLIWDMACSASELNVSPFLTEEYDKLYALGWYFSDYKLSNEWMTDIPIEEKIMFTFMIYYSLP